MKHEHPTFADFDKLALKPFAEKLLGYISTEHRFVEGALVVSLEAPFGSGKSTFLAMFADMIESIPANDRPFALTVRLNAWESDFGEDPVLAIVSGIAEAVAIQRPDVDDEVLTKMKSAAGMVGRVVASVASDVVANKIGVDLAKAVASGKGKPPAEDTGMAAFKTYQIRKKAIGDLKESISEFTGETGLKVLLLVDELDRCRPAYAIDYLESLKHLFDDPNFTAILGIDRKQMASSSKSLFGSDLDFDEYFRKFAHRRVPLPALNSENSTAFCEGLVRDYLETGNPGQASFGKFDSNRIRNISDLFLSLGLNARQAHEAMRVTAHCMRVEQAKKGQMLWGWHVATMFLVALSISNRERYFAIGTGRMPADEFARLAASLGQDRNSEWWKLVLLGGYLGVEKDEEIAALRKTLGIDETKEETWKRLTGIMDEGFNRWGMNRPAPISKIFDVIESLDSFVK